MFNGFTQEALDFMAGIEVYNNKEWFTAHKRIYTEAVYAPLAALGEELFGGFAQDEDWVWKASRIYRDPFLSPTRHYRDEMWIYILHETQFWSEEPILFFSLNAGGAQCGLRLTHPKPAAMARFRHRIQADPAGFQMLTEPILKKFRISGDAYKRQKPDMPQGTEDFFQRKQILCTQDIPAGATLFSRRLVNRIRRTFEACMPLMDYLHQAVRPQEENAVQEPSLPLSRVEDEYGGFMW